MPLSRGLVLVVLQANLKLFDRFLRCRQGFSAVPAEVMRGVFHVLLRAAQRRERFADLRMRLRRGGRGSGGERARCGWFPDVCPFLCPRPPVRGFTTHGSKCPSYP